MILQTHFDVKNTVAGGPIVFLSMAKIAKVDNPRGETTLLESFGREARNGLRALVPPPAADEDQRVPHLVFHLPAWSTNGVIPKRVRGPVIPKQLT